MKALAFLCRETGTHASEWKAADGPDSGTGVDYYFEHPSLGMWYVNDDQGEFTAEPCSPEP